VPFHTTPTLPLWRRSRSLNIAAMNFSKEEETVLARWRAIDAFKIQLELNKDNPPFAFYDGPPFATGLPHYGHILTSTIKDVIPRYWAMKGYLVERRFGWDTHGVPIEYEIDKAFGIKGKQEILAFGLAKYNEECRNIVMRYAAEWRTMIERLGRWVDFDNDYKVSHKFLALFGSFRRLISEVLCRLWT
jgi:isoleucyl-tRNA synthetase